MSVTLQGLTIVRKQEKHHNIEMVNKYGTKFELFIPEDFYNRIRVGYELCCLIEDGKIIEISGFKNTLGDLKRCQLCFGD